MTAAPQYPPFMFAYTCLGDIFAKIQAHDTPEVFSHDFLRFTLGFSRESDRAFIALAKRGGLLTTEGKPTDLYLRLRDPAQTPAAVTVMMKQGFSMLYAKNADVNDLDRKAVAAMLLELTGMEHGSPTVRAIVGTFFSLKALASPPVVVERVANRRKATERRGR